MDTEQVATVLIKEAYRKGLVDGAKILLDAAQAMGSSPDVLECAMVAVNTHVERAMIRADEELSVSSAGGSTGL